MSTQERLLAGDKMKIIKDSGLIAFGDSLTVGFNASPQTLGYSRLLADDIGGTFNNYGLGSSTSTYSAKTALASLPVGNRARLSTWMAGLNDIRHSGLNAIPRLENNLRAYLAACFLNQVCPASQMTRTGTWINMSQSVGGKALAVGGNALYSTGNANATLEWTFQGDNVVIGGFMTNGIGQYTYQNLTIEIDGQYHSNFQCLGTTNENISYGAKVISCLGEGQHTIKLNATTANQYTVIDYVGTLGQSAPVFVSEIPYLLNWAQYNSVATQAICDAANVVINNVVNEFRGYPIQVIKVNDFYDPTASGQCSSDGIHPTNLGHSKILDAFKDKVELVYQVLQPAGTTQLTVNQSGIDTVFDIVDGAISARWNE
jgi:lysophospholipase L1-like esterase